MQVGAPLEPSVSADELATVLNGLFATVGDALEPIDLSCFQPLYRSRLSMNKRWDWLRHALRRNREEFDEHNR